VGNSEIRLRFGEMLVYSNFGIVNAYFDSRGDQVDVLLMGNDAREVEILGY